MILLFLALVGATEIICTSRLFKRIRELSPIDLSCHQCVGMWIGGAIGLGEGHYPNLINFMIYGSATSLLATFTAILLGRLER